MKSQKYVLFTCQVCRESLERLCCDVVMVASDEGDTLAPTAEDVGYEAATDALLQKLARAVCSQKDFNIQKVKS